LLQWLARNPDKIQATQYCAEILNIFVPQGGE